MSDVAVSQLFCNYLLVLVDDPELVSPDIPSVDEIPRTRKRSDAEVASQSDAVHTFRRNQLNSSSNIKNKTKRDSIPRRGKEKKREVAGGGRGRALLAAPNLFHLRLLLISLPRTSSRVILLLAYTRCPCTLPQITNHTFLLSFTK